MKEAIKGYAIKFNDFSAIAEKYVKFAIQNILKRNKYLCLFHLNTYQKNVKKFIEKRYNQGPETVLPGKFGDASTTDWGILVGSRKRFGDITWEWRYGDTNENT